MSAAPAPSAGHFQFRRLTSSDAQGVVELVKAVYGDSYYPRTLYDADRIVQLNQSGELASVIALDKSGQVVGHYAYERPDRSAIAEASDAIVLPADRHQHILEESRTLLRAAALEAGLLGLVGYPVTNHVYSQKAEEHWGAHPCAVALGLWPKTFHNMPEPLPQRMSFVVYFKPLKPLGGRRHEITRHQPMLERLAGQYGLAVEAIPPSAPAGAGELTAEAEAEVQTGLIRVRRVGADTAAAIRRSRDELLRGGAEALTLELPLGQPGTAAVCDAAEQEGFSFSGLGPAFHDGSDALLLQWLGAPLDPKLVQLENPLAQELLAYAAGERQRLRQAK